VRDHGSLNTTLSVLALLVAVVAGHLTLAPRVADLDGFYHMAHAARYAETTPWDTGLPWASQSAIAEEGADIWWGFHVALVPLARWAVADDGAADGGEERAGPDRITWAMMWGAFILTLVLASSSYVFLRLAGVAGAGWWAALVLIAVPNVFYRYLMLRPHVLSLAAAMLLLSALSRARWGLAFLAAALIAWLHLSLFWLPLVVLGSWMAAVAVERWSVRDPRPWGALPWAAALAVGGGVVVGWLARPHPWAAGRLVYIQLFELLDEKASDLPITFAPELVPLTPALLVLMAGFVLFWWTVGVVWVGREVAAIRGGRVGGEGEPAFRSSSSGGRATLIALTFLSVGFLVLTMVVARRALVEWALFATLLLPLAAGMLLPPVQLRRWGVAFGVSLVVLLPWAARRHALNVRYVSFGPDYLREAATWLAAHSDTGDVVFHTHWDQFGPLLARNRINHYIGGMDPIFQMSRSRERYWEHFYLSRDLTTDYTCDAFPCASGVARDTHEVIRDTFNARWVLLEHARSPKLIAYLDQTPGFRRAFETEREVVFEVMGDADAPDAIIHGGG